MSNLIRVKIVLTASHPEVTATRLSNRPDSRIKLIDHVPFMGKKKPNGVCVNRGILHDDGTDVFINKATTARLDNVDIGDRNDGNQIEELAITIFGFPKNGLDAGYRHNASKLAYSSLSSSPSTLSSLSNAISLPTAS